jgi:asparagine synthase (glutamine-hydrolysing)
MCGIIGSVNYLLDIPSIHKAMLHRGPDEQNEYREDGVHFYHFRLSILDVEGGKQPMTYEHLTIIFNGEIYNHLEVRKKYNLVCKTNSDTETILALYIKIGERCLDEFDGMFAFAIYDKKKQEIFLARDRAGEKPLYIYKNNKQLVFASELNALKAILPLEINEGNIANYMRLGSMYRSQTPYKNVTELSGGHFAIIDILSSSLHEKKWWGIDDFYLKSTTDSFEQAIDKTNQYLIQSVKRRIDSSDLEVGAFLSGGIDSGLVTAIASQHTSNLRTFTVSFKGDYDEAPLAKLVADKYNTNHTEIKVSFDNLINDVEDIICNYGEPFFDSSAIPSYYVSQKAKEYITVVLNGDGADELFGGYRRYVPFAYVDFFKMPSLLKLLSKNIHKVLPPAHSKKSMYNYLYRLFDFAGKNDIDTYLSSTADIMEGYLENLQLKSFGSDDIHNDFQKILNSERSGLKKIMNLDFNTILSSDLLVKMDIATMAHSLEGRSPFLSKELLEFSPTLSTKFKVKGSVTKRILRELSKEYLPPQLINQPKRGFEIPLKKWIDKDLKDVIFDYLGDNAYCYSFVDKTFVQNLKQNKVKISKEKRAKILWMLFTLEVWYKKNYVHA